MRMTLPPGLDDVGRNIAIHLSADTSKYANEMIAAGHVTGELIEEVTGLDEVIHRTMRRAGLTLAGLGIAMQGTTAIWTNQAIQWESSFSNVVKTVEDTPQALRNVSRELRQMSARDLPVTAHELANLATIAGQLGIQTDNIAHFVETAARLGVAVDDMGAEEAIFNMSQFINIMGEAEENVDRVASSLVMMGNTFPAMEGQVLRFSTRMAGAAAIAGLTSAEVIGISTAFASAGVEAERGSTAVQRALLEMNDAVSNGGVQLERFARVVGMTSDEFARMFRERPAEVFIALLEALGEAGDEANLVLQQLGLQDARLVAAFLAVANASFDLRSSINASNQAFSENVELLRESDEFFQTVALRFRQFGNSMSEMARSLGQGFLPILRVMLNTMTGLVNVINSIPQPIMTMIGLMTALSGGMFVVVGILLTLSRAFELAFAAHFVGRITRVRVAIAGLLAGLLELNSATMLMQRGRMGAFFVSLGAGIRETVVAMTHMLARIPGLGRGISAITAMLGSARLAAINAASGVNLVRSAILALAGSVAVAGVTLGSFMLIAAALYGTFRAGQWAIGQFRNDMIATTEAVDALASSMDVAIRSFGALEQRLQEGTDTSKEFAQANQDVIRMLRRAANDAERLALLTDIVFQLQLRGATNEEIQEMVDRLLGIDGANIRIDFDVDTVDFHSLLDAVEQRIQNLSLMVERTGLQLAAVATMPALGLAHGALPGAQKHEISQLTGPWAEMLVEMLRGDIDDQLAAFDLLEAINEHAFDGFEGREARERFSRQLRRAAVGEDIALGWWEQIRAGFRSVFRMGNPVDEVLGDLGENFLAPLDDFIEAAERAGVEMGDVWIDNIMRAIATQDMWVDSLKELRAEQERQARAMEQQTEFARLLGDRWWEMDSAARRSLEQQVANQLVMQRGHEAAIDVLREEMEWLEANGQEHEERGRTIRSIIDKVVSDWDRMQDRIFRREIGRMSTIDAIDEIHRRLADLDPTMENFLDRQSRLLDELFRLEDRAVQELMSALDQWERLQQRQADVQERHNERMASLEADRQRQLERTHEQLDNSLRRINERFEEQLRQRAESLSRWASFTEREWSQHTASMARIIANARIQEEMFGAWQRGLDELRRRGMSEEAIEALGLTESPRALQQIERILQGSADQIEEFNRLVERRNNETRRHVEDNSQDLVSEVARSREEAAAEFERSVEEINRRFQEQVSDLNATLAREMGSIAEEMAKIGADTGESWADAVARAMETGHENIIRIAEDVSRVMSQSAADVARFTAASVESLADWAELMLSPEMLTLNESILRLTGRNVGPLPAQGERGGHEWFQHGSIFSSPRVIGVGEGGPEAVLPLDRRGADFLAMTMKRFQSPSGGGHGMDRELRDLLAAAALGSGMKMDNVHVYPKDFQEFFHQLKQRQRRGRLIASASGGEVGD